MNEWIEHKGDECPVEMGTLVDVKLKNGKEYQSEIAWGLNHDSRRLPLSAASSRAGSAYWTQHGMEHDIAFYRLSEIPKESA